MEFRINSTIRDNISHITQISDFDGCDLETVINSIIKYYESIINCMPGNVYWFDKDCVAVGCNQNVLNMFGFDNITQFRGLTFDEMGKQGNWEPEATASFKNDTLAVLKSGEPKLNVEEPPLYNADGNPVYFLSSRVPIFDEAGKSIGLVGISVDITQRKLAEHLAVEKAKVEETQENTLRLASSIAHDLRNYLAIMRTGTQGVDKILKKNNVFEQLSDRDSKAVSRAVDITLRNNQQANEFIDLTLECLKPIDKNGENNFTEFDINPIIAEALEGYQMILPRYDELIHWDDSVNFKIYGRETYLSVMLQVMINNALEAIRENRDQGEITIWATQEADRNTLHIKDTAIGCDEETLKYMFDTFFTTKTSGTGIGLSASARRIQIMGGRIIPHSIKGEYMQFDLHFPIAG